jgi:trehalose utilization protein
MSDNHTTLAARLATLAVLRRDVLPLFITPVPCDETLRAWFDQAHIPRFKANATARRGGGPVFYSVPAVEKLLKSRTA